MKWRQRFGLWRSIAIYYLKPFNRKRLIKFYGQFIKPEDLCFDIGAHLGNRSAAFLALKANVVSLEPQPICISYLEKKFNNNPSITIVQKGVAANPGIRSMHLSHSAPTISTLTEDDTWRERVADDTGFEVDWSERIDVECTTLDELIDEYGVPAFCKIDVENYELEVLKGLSIAIPCLSFEYYPPFTHSATECIDLLTRLGSYEFNWSFGETLRLNSVDWIEAGEMKRILSGYSKASEYGDIYARLK